MTEAMIRSMLERSFSADQTAPTEAGRAAAIRTAREDRIRSILASPTCIGEGITGTAYALLNAVTEFVDHERPTRTWDGQVSGMQRFASAHWGSSASIKAAAFEAIIELSRA